ncbi:hypothetical protein Godav_027154 [Gossypium davidsonii]|uniref:RNase H type-1 domain-containing protein n=2 Tax=Gossypium TaxID=3633 RepID=A0A7J8RV97_GOSDV|nr:hypothetical protein [Gossypium davidsonii]MBA0653077.1 hypothetical protein [Gossypium klotzschianum]
MANMRDEFKLKIGDLNPQTLFATLCWLLWKNRNTFIFQQVFRTADELIRKSDRLVTNACDVVINQSKKRGDQIERSRWKPPDFGWIKINTDDATSRNGNWSIVDSRFVTLKVIGWKALKRVLGTRTTLKAILYGLKVVWLLLERLK